MSPMDTCMLFAMAQGITLTGPPFFCEYDIPERTHCSNTWFGQYRDGREILRDTLSEVMSKGLEVYGEQEERKAYMEWYIWIT